MHPVERVFLRRLLARINEEAAAKVECVARGMAKDYADYQSQCGYIQALDHVRDWCREIAETDEPARPDAKPGMSS